MVRAGLLIRVLTGLKGFHPVCVLPGNFPLVLSIPTVFIEGFCGWRNCFFKPWWKEWA